MKTLRFGTFCGLVLGAGWLMLLSGCMTEPVTGRQQFNFMPQSQEMQLGLTSFEQLKKDTPINRDPALNALVQKVGRRIAAAAAKDLPDAQWEFVVFESKEANAFCLPGGKVGVYTGLLPISLDEAGLATVVGHEVAHAAARHGGERMSEALALQGVSEALGAGLAKTDPRTQAAVSLAYNLGSQVGVALPHSRTQETSADEIGLIYMARAGYDPAAAVAFWERFANYNKAAGASTPWFLRTHPVDADRIQTLKAWLPKARQEYRPQ
jgi:metalloendopeptidase OMA1, mitochondrial